MSPEVAGRLKQELPNVYCGTNFECDDDWLPLLISFGGRLHALLGSEAIVCPDAQCAVQRIAESGGGLSIELSDFCRAKDASSLQAEFEALSRSFAASLQDQNPYLFTHNVHEQSAAEESVRADASDMSAAEMQFTTVADAKRTRIEEGNKKPPRPSEYYGVESRSH